MQNRIRGCICSILIAADDSTGRADKGVSYIHPKMSESVNSLATCLEEEKRLAVRPAKLWVSAVSAVVPSLPVPSSDSSEWCLLGLVLPQPSVQLLCLKAKACSLVPV